MSMSTRSKTARLAAVRRSPPPSLNNNNNNPSSPPASPDTAADGTPSEDKCAICLSPIVNKCKTNSCSHEFCFACLLEWSKVKAECPLCKSTLSAIRHNIRVVDGQESFDTYAIPEPPPDDDLFGNGNLFGSHVLRVGPLPWDRFPRIERLDDFLNGYNVAYSPHIHHHHTLSSHPLWRSPSRGPPPPAHASSSRVHAHHDHRSFFHLLEFGTNMIPEGLSINPVPVPSASAPLGFNGLENPFVSLDDDFAGSELFPQEEVRRAHGTQSYQRRRRIYDRGQKVSPFPSTLQPGAVLFPSVEYFRTHPTAFARIKPWLKRELTVLLGLTTPRSRLAAVYEVIISMLLRHEIRGREFREMIRIYFDSSAQLKHFQHEFYHFVVSGMNMEAYDNVATYESSSQPATAARESQHSRHGIPVVTIDDDDDVEATNRNAPSSSLHDSTTNGQSHSHASRRYGQQRERRSRSRRASPRDAFDTERLIARYVFDLTHLDQVGLRRRERPRLRFRDNYERRSRSRSRSREEETTTRSHSSSQPRIPPPAISAPEPSTNNDDGGDDDDCQLLGVHPIVKPPPLAVITIDSDTSDHEESPESASNKNKIEESAVAADPMQSTSAAGAGTDRQNSHNHKSYSQKPTTSSGQSYHLPIYEITITDPLSPDSSVEEIYRNMQSFGPNTTNNGRPSSPKPSTSAASRGLLPPAPGLPIANNRKWNFMKKSDYLLQRMLNDIDKVPQESLAEIDTLPLDDDDDIEDEPCVSYTRIEMPLREQTDSSNSSPQTQDDGPVGQGTSREGKRTASFFSNIDSKKFRNSLEDQEILENMLHESTQRDESDWECKFTPFTSEVAERGGGTENNNEEEEIEQQPATSYYYYDEVHEVREVSINLENGVGDEDNLEHNDNDDEGMMFLNNPDSEEDE